MMNKRIRYKHRKMIFDRSQYNRAFVVKMAFRALENFYRRHARNITRKINWDDDDDS